MLFRSSKTDFEQYLKTFENSDINFNIKCIETTEDCKNDVSWTNSGKVVNEAWNQFYGRILNKDWENLGLSYIGFLISILLSASATVLLYTSSIDVRNRASRSSLLKQWRNKYLNELDFNDDLKEN